MTIDKQALREEFRNMQDHYSDPADRERQEIYISPLKRCWMSWKPKKNSALTGIE